MPASIYPISATDELVVYESGLAVLRHQTPFHPGRWSVYGSCRPGDGSEWSWHAAAWRSRPKPLTLDSFTRMLEEG